MLLRVLGAEVETAFDGPSALDAIRRKLVEVVFLDINIPGMDGYTVATEVRRDPHSERLTLIALTGCGQETAPLAACLGNYASTKHSHRSRSQPIAQSVSRLIMQLQGYHARHHRGAHASAKSSVTAAGGRQPSSAKGRHRAAV